MSTPNVLFLSADQLSYDALSCTGNPYVSTPNLDDLAEQGMLFERAYCTDPVCAPSRGSWMTGRYSSETGLAFNDGEIWDDITDLGEHLRAHGIHTAHSGKWHVLGRPISRGFEVLYDGRRKILASAGELYDTSIGLEAAAFLESYRGDRPFFLQAHFVNPHDICEFLHSYEDQGKHIKNLVELGVVGEDELPLLPPNFDADTKETVTQIVCRRQDRALIHDEIRSALEHWTELDWRSYFYQYYRFVEKVDAEIGRLLGALRESRFARDTVILFTTDHGESCGNHRMFQKFTLYEESVHVPLIVASYSDQWGICRGARDREHLVSGVDIFPTVCDLLGVPVPDDLTGISFWPAARGEKGPEREALYIESNLFGRAVIEGRYKLVTEYRPDPAHPNRTVNADHNVTGRAQLFDLETDPRETRNLVDERPDVVAALGRRLLELEGDLRQREIPNQKGREVERAWCNALQAYWDRAEARA